MKFMCSEHSFLEDRISKFSDMLVSAKSQIKQKSMGDWT